MDYDPFDVILTGNFENLPKGANVYSEAIKSLFHDFKPHKIETLLNADSEPVVSDGLMILSEMGEKGSCLVDLALKHIGHKDWTARFYLADFLLACYKYLSVSQIGVVLKLCVDENVRVRCKSMEIISLLDVENIKSAVQEGQLFEHKQQFEAGITFLKAKKNSLTKIKRSINSDSLVERCFAGAFVLRLARATPCDLSIEAETDEEKYLSNRLKQICRYKL